MPLQYGWWPFCEGHYSGWGVGGGGILCCLPNNNLLYGWQQNLFQVGLGDVHIDPSSGYTSSGFVLSPGGGFSAIGRDLIAYVYVRDPKAW